MEGSKEIIKKYGDIFLTPDDVLKRDTTIIPVSPKLDIGLSGGVPVGSWVILSGKPKIGKSTIALTICKNAQKKEYGSRKVFYHDVEGRLKKINLEGIEGLDLSPDKFHIIRSTKDKFLTGQDHLDIAESLIKSNPGCVHVIDSSSSLCSSKEMEESIDSNRRNDAPKLFATFTRKLAGIVPVQESIVIIIQHLIANTSGYGPAFMEDGGNKIQFQADIKLRATSFSKWQDGEKVIGQKPMWEVIYSALGPPNQKVEGYIRYGKGVDEVNELFELACDLGLIDKSGAWFVLNFMKEPIKVQGQAKACKHLEDNPKDKELLQKKIKEFYAC